MILLKMMIIYLKILCYIKIIEIKIYDVNGREVATLIKEKKDVGTYTVRWDAANYPIGIYFYQMRTNTGFSEVNRMILIK